MEQNISYNHYWKNLRKMFGIKKRLIKSIKKRRANNTMTKRKRTMTD
jgi:hypothetical protein